MKDNSTSWDARTGTAFVIAVIFLGVNFVAVRVSNQELPPFWGAALRFIIATVILFGLVRWQKQALPQGRALTGAALYGLFSFAINYAFLYWGLTRVSAGMGSVLFATIPLMTHLMASLTGQESFTWKGLSGSLIVIVGIGVVFFEQLKFNVPFVYMGALLAGVASTAFSGIVVKHFPRSHPLSTNAVGMAIGAALLLVLSILTGETLALPTLGVTWLALAWLVLSSIVGFVLIVWLLSYWSATATSYIGVLTPLVTLVVAAWLAGETPSLIFLAGSLIVLLGVYVGALSPQRTPRAESVRADG